MLRLILALSLVFTLGRTACAEEQPPDATPAAIDSAINRGIQFLIDDQNRDGSWGTAERTKGLNIYAPVPGAHHAFRSAVTALCVSALCETGGESADVRAAIERGEAWMCEHLPKLRRANGDALYNIWGHAYAIEAFVHLHRRHAGNVDVQAEMLKQIATQIDLLDRYETVSGGWGYYDFNAQTQKPSGDPNSFVTATVLIAFEQAKTIGAVIPQRLSDRGLAVVKRQRLPDFAYVYSENLKYMPQHPINRPGGSLGRSQACNYVLRLYGDAKITDAVLKEWLERLITRNLWLDIGRKRPIPHESWYAVAGYFFYYGHYYSSFCIEALPEADRPALRRKLATIIVQRQEKDGSWWDYPLYNYHQQYGTAFALMTLRRCQAKEK